MYVTLTHLILYYTYFQDEEHLEIICTSQLLVLTTIYFDVVEVEVCLFG